MLLPLVSVFPWTDQKSDASLDVVRTKRWPEDMGKM